MSLHATNTPNGASKDLYSKNEDVGKQEVAVTDMSQKDPSKDLTGNVPGDNTVAEVSIVIDNSVAIRDAGSLVIKATLVGEPQIAGPEATNNIKLSIEKIKNAMKAKGVLMTEDYLNLKRDMAEKSKVKEEYDDKDKNNDGIDDRNQ